MTSKIHPCWLPVFEKHNIDLASIYENGIVHPPIDLVYRVFEMDVNDINILLLGQDPYHGPGQANGLSFSVSDDIKVPPSLNNIFKELQMEFPERGYEFNNGNLERWYREEKIFLLNASLTVYQGLASSHMKIWEKFTDDIIEFIAKNNKKCIFLLLGNFAKGKNVFIMNEPDDIKRIVEETHPSPLARGFIGSNVFKRVESALGREINWSI